MKLTVVVQPSTAKNKKYVAVFYDEDSRRLKTVHFGDSRYEDYTQHKDPARREGYLRRHRVQENWEDPYTAGFWSRHLLWEDTSIFAAANKIKSKFGLNLTLQKKRKA